MEKENKIYCYTSTEPCIHSRRCFMTGEYCSKQPNIQRERKKLHDNKKEKKEVKIRAFVIMNFSDMSDVVYKWRIRPFIESLSKYLYVEGEKLYCSSVEENANENDKRHPVTEIEVVRSDSDPASNYVICSRICQQMQIADLIIVDVSNQNANVFYEFGMAVALGKMILPICYSESFYKRVTPKEIKNIEFSQKKEWEDIEHHIGFYPWRKDLFEYYGIRYRTTESKTEYLDYEKAIDAKYGFSDSQYSRFPYHEKLILEKNIKEGYNPKEEKGIGQNIYEKLRAEYNNEDKKAIANTLVVYTMDAFLNEEEAGRCIVNFYQKIVLKMKEEKCFCGERVGVLVQGNVIPESEKDAKEEVDIEYSIGEIIQIGTNQATYLAAEEKIKSDDEWPDSLGCKDESEERAKEPSPSQQKGIERFVKKHITNRAMRVYPNNPVFVDRMKNLLHKDLLNQSEGEDFYLYYVMLRTLRYTNEIVVDISNNCLQSLFWLGAAHGSDIYAITVMHEKTDSEKRHNVDELEKENRYIFDVAGLWMAILRKNDTEGFYLQLAAAQSGIERHSKLMLPNIGSYKEKLKEYLFSFSGISSDERPDPKELDRQKGEEEEEILESYYRDRFWAPMLSYNQLSIYLSHQNEQGAEDKEPRLCMPKWDFSAVSVLSHYLSKRKIIGEYSLVSLAKEERSSKAKQLNFICVGSEVWPLEGSQSMASYVNEEILSSQSKNKEENNIVHKKTDFFGESLCDEQKGEKKFKGFSWLETKEENKGIFTHQPNTRTCAKCEKLKKESQEVDINIFYDKKEINEKVFCQFMLNEHIEMAQLILWRDDDSAGLEQDNYFRVGIIGCSGPATSALSVLFVDEEEIENQLIEDRDKENKAKWKDGNLLCELQRLARKKFMDIFLKKLHQMLEEEIWKYKDKSENAKEQMEKYYVLVRHAVVFYLKTVLYRYFFPFLSEKDMERIYNGMYTFINSMKAARISPFALGYHSIESESVISDNIIEEIVNKIPELLHGTLKSFRGIEAFYKVTVAHDLNNARVEKDTRRIEKIELMEEGEISPIKYLFI